MRPEGAIPNATQSTSEESEEGLMFENEVVPLNEEYTEDETYKLGAAPLLPSTKKYTKLFVGFTTNLDIAPPENEIGEPADMVNDPVVGFNVPKYNCPPELKKI
jgi:hypothetical protein